MRHVFIAALLSSPLALAQQNVNEYFFPTQSFKASELLNQESISKLSTNPNAYNLCQRVACAHPTEKPSDPYFPRAMMQNIGKLAGLQGDALYYPFGGEDSATPFTLQPDAIDVFAWGADRFGHPNHDFLSQGQNTYRHFHYTQSLTDENMGQMAARNIHHILGSKIEGVFYFNLDKDGRAQFIPISDEVINMKPWQVEIEVQKDPSKFQNGVIVFRDPQTKQLKRYWYLQAVLPDVDTAFVAFINRLKFSTLLIKAVPEGLFEEPHMRPSTISLTLDPAKKNHARVFTDERQLPATNGIPPISEGRHPPRIFLKDHPPKRIPLENGAQNFGYSGYRLIATHRDSPITLMRKNLRPQHGVYVANASDLISESTPPDQIYRPTILRGIFNQCQNLLARFR